MAGAQSTIISKGMRFRKLGLNPLESTAPVDFCRFCQDEVDTEVQQGKWEQLFVYRKQCRRCGQTIQWGVGKSALTDPTPTTMQAVTSWIQTAGHDRR